MGASSFQSNQKWSFVPLPLQRKAFGEQGNQLPRLPLPGCVGWWFVESSQCPQLSFAGCPLMSPSVAWLIKPCWMFMFWWVSTWLLLSHSFLKEALERPVGKWAMFQRQKCARACCLGEQLALQWLMGTPFISGVFFHFCYERNEGHLWRRRDLA